MLVECSGINQEFVTVYIMLHEIHLDDLQLQERRQNKSFVYYIRNLEITRNIVESSKKYRESNVTLSEYFGRNIIYAQKSHRERKNFILKEKKNITNPLLLYKVGNRCHLNENIKDVILSEPKRMSVDDILLLHGIKEKFDIDDFDKLEEKYRIQFQFYKLCIRIEHYKEKIVGRECLSLPKVSQLSWKPQQIINIGQS